MDATVAPGPPQPIKPSRTIDSLCIWCEEIVAVCRKNRNACPWWRIDEIASAANFLVVMQHGCPAFVRVYKCVDEERQRALVHELLPHLHTLSMDAFANYAVQCVIEHSDRTTAAQYVVQCFAGHLLKMSCDKFASNVVEKVVRVCGGVPAVRRLLLDELIFNPAALKELVSDGYGNFVVQSVISTLEGFSLLTAVIRAMGSVLEHCPYSTNIWAKINARRRELTMRRRSEPLEQAQLPQQPIAMEPPQYQLCAQEPECEPLFDPVSKPELPTSSRWSRQQQGVRHCGNGRFRHCPYSVELFTTISLPAMATSPTDPANASASAVELRHAPPSTASLYFG